MTYACPMKKTVLVAALFLAGLAIGFGMGARVGTYQHGLADAQYKASILAFQLQALKAGKPEPALAGMEISLSGEIANHGRYMDSHLKWLWPEMMSEDDQPIRRAVAYRLANPYELPDHTKPENWRPGVDMESAFVKKIIEGQKEMNTYLEKVLKHHGSHRSGLQKPAPGS